MKKKQKIELHSRNIERLLLAGATLLMAVMAFSYYSHIKKDLSDAEQGYANNTIINLSAPVKAETLKGILTKGGYFTDASYINFITDRLKQKVDEQKRLPNLGALNKDPMLIDAMEFLQTGSESGKLRFINSLAHLGTDSALYAQEKTVPSKFPSEVKVSDNEGGVSINGTIRSKTGGNAESGVLIRLAGVNRIISIYKCLF